jgi:nucleoid-associated protein YgaU
LKFLRIAEVAFMTALAASIQGCGKPVLRVADASIGDYYTEKEFKKLSKEQKAEYCAELARQDSIYKQELLGLHEELDQTKARSQRLREEGDSLFALGTALESRVAVGGGRAGRRPEPGDGARGSTHTVRPGESLWAISAASFGEGRRWPRLYAANRSRIRDPNLIYPGQELSIPK